jgi:hypothetical protein
MSLDKKNNTGLYNSGYHNSGNYNSGYRNSGYRNSGDYNSGYRNSGYRNSGDYNSGYRNSGYYNSGYHNSGDYNSGDYNSGNYNSGNYNSGWFNTNEPKMRFFNKDSDITYSEFVKGKIVYPDLKICSWVDYKDLPADEQNSDTKNMDGKLKTLSYEDAWKEYWNRASEKDKEWFKNLPNFSAEIFEEITGIKIDEEKSLVGQEVSVTVGGKTYKAKIVE